MLSAATTSGVHLALSPRATSVAPTTALASLSLMRVGKLSDDTKIRELKVKTDVKEVVEDCLKWCEGCEAIMIVALDKNGTQILRTSTMSGMQKSFLVSFLNAWMAKWFGLEHA